MSIKNILKYTLIFALIVIGIFIVIDNFSIGQYKIDIDESIQTNYTEELKIAGETVYVEFADTKEKQSKGLSDRAPLKDSEGMLFVFDVPNDYKFWMKDMNFAIDMIWLDTNKKVIYIEKNATPESYPELFGPNEDAKYVLEVVSGFSDKHSIKIGDEVKF